VTNQESARAGQTRKGYPSILTVERKWGRLATKLDNYKSETFHTGQIVAETRGLLTS